MINNYRFIVIGNSSFIHNFKCLAEREDKTGVFYLTWLLGQSDNVIIGRLLIDAIDYRVYVNFDVVCIYQVTLHHCLHSEYKHEQYLR